MVSLSKINVGYTRTMSKNLSSEQSSVNNAVEFNKNFHILAEAGIGVVLVRTREPFRVIQTLHHYALTEKSPEFRVWTIAHGWATYGLKKEGEPVYDGTVDPLAALKMLNQEGVKETGATGSVPRPRAKDNKPFGDGIFVMMHAHRPISANIAMIQLIKEYANEFTENAKRLVLITPLGWEPPEELQDDLVILDFNPPSYAELSASRDKIFSDVPADKVPPFTKNDIERILSAGAGMTQHEFENALSRAMVANRKKLPNVGIDEFCEIILKAKTEVVKRSEVLEVMEPGKMEEVGGLENLKAWINKRAQCFSQESRDFGVEPPKGIALFGPPGVGKSATSKAIASTLGIPLLKFDVSRVFNSLVGSSEARVRNALKLVDAMAPCVMLLDEVDKAFAGQANGGGGGDSGVGMRILGSILNWMQETKSPVFVVATANRVENVPTEFLRKGRLDEIFSVTVPNEVERLEILKIHLRKRKCNPETMAGLNTAVEKSEGYVAAEIEAAVKDALIEAYTTKQDLTGQLIADQLDSMTPISEAFKEQFDSMRLWAEKNARPASAQVKVVESVKKITPRARAMSNALSRKLSELN